MKAYGIFDRYQTINGFIIQKNTGTPDEFAKKIGVSRRQIFKDLKDLRSLGAKISYSPSRRTYYYRNGFDFYIDLIIHD